jgi:DNA repair protein SbcC/Rad50
MRILRLCFKNLNSLAGKWEIDFTSPEYISSGIFAITGPTGAGKSTILDAICLALYGRTPRLGKMTNKSGEVMSRQTGEYFSEVEFVSEKGHFCCKWYHWRADKKPDGKLQQPRHEIAYAKTGKVIESNLAAVADKVLEVTGLDYHQFTRSILLAQGEFDTFLDSPAEERAQILEKITDTRIYGKISVKVHERYTQEKSDLVQLKNQESLFQIITPERADALQQEIQLHEKEIDKLTLHLKDLEGAITWLDIIAALSMELTRLQVQQDALNVRKENSRKDLDALSLARKARDLEGIYSGLFALRELQGKETVEKKDQEVNLEEFCAAYANALDAFRSAEEQRTVALDEKRQEDAIIRHVRDLDSRIRETRANRDERETEKHRSEEESKRYNVAIGSAEYQLKEIRENLSKAAMYLEAHPRDQKLIESLSGIESAIRQIYIVEETAEKKRIELHTVSGELADAEEVVIRRKPELDKSTKNVQDALAAVSRVRTECAEITGGRDITALRENADWENDRRNRIQLLLDLFIRIEEDIAERKKHTETLDAARAERAMEEQQCSSLQKDVENAARLVKVSEKNLVYLAQIKSYEDARKTLPEGTPCPLCGSADHPWCTGVVPVTDDAQKEHDEYKKAEEFVQKNVRLSEARLAGIDAGIRAGESARAGLEQKIGRATLDLESGCRDIDLSGGNITKPAITAALDESAARLNKIRETLARAEEKEKTIQENERQVNRDKDLLEEIKKDYEKLISYRDDQNRDRERLIKEIAATDAEYKRQNAALLESIQEYDILVFDSTPLPKQILAKLTERRNAYIENFTRRQDLQNSRLQYDAELEKNQSLLSSVEKTLVDVLEKFSRLDADLKKYSSERLELYNDKDPAVEEARVTRQVEAAEEVLSVTTEAKNLIDKKKNSCEEQIKNLTKKVSDRIPILAANEGKFSDTLTGTGFIDENQFLSSRLTHDQFIGLEQLETDIKREETEIIVALKDRSEKMETELERALTMESREDLTTARENSTNRKNVLQIEIGGIRRSIEQYKEQVVQYLALKEQITKQEKEFAKWESLNNIIGTTTGNKTFKVFAQSLTFETLVMQANRHLWVMSDHRYLLIRNKDPDHSLDLDIMDNDQAGEIRTTKNLSGGERFIVSLALALGLSGMASKNIRIDSLFLDEGFGTLDDNTLETALQTLSSLQRDGKIIGIISHVSALKERIPLQIQVDKIGNGRSRLSGPGCSST